MGFPGPTAQLRGTNRRIGRSGTVWINGEMHGEIVNVQWGRQAEQIAIAIPGSFQDETKPGGETASGSFRYDDVDDRWRLFMWRFFEARRQGVRAGAAFPEFDIITRLSDIGSPQDSVWVLEGCQLFQMDGGFGQDMQNLQHDVPFQYRRERPLNAFEYGPSGVVVTRA